MNLNRQRSRRPGAIWLLSLAALYAAAMSCNMPEVGPTGSVTPTQAATTPASTTIPTPTPEPFLNMPERRTERPVYHYIARMRTTSDWTRTLIEGADAAAVGHTILEGTDLPTMQIRRIPELRIQDAGGPETVAEVEFDLYLGEIEADSIQFGIGKGHISQTNLELLAVDGEEQIPVQEMVHRGVADSSDRFNRRWFEIDLDTLAARGSVNIPDKVYPRKLFAFYYPWYGSPNGPTGFPRAWEDKPPPNTPVLGLYDSKDPEVFRQHIDQARQAGIDGFIVSWWGVGDFTDEVLQNVILPVAEEEGFPITLYYETANSREQIVRDFRHILTTYGRSPAYMRVDGAPVLFVYNQVSTKFGREMWQYVFDQLRAGDLDCFCHAAGLAPAFHLGQAQFDYLFDLFDGVHMYFQGEIPPDRLAILNSGNALRAAVEGTSYAATVNPGFDNSPWYTDHGFNQLVIDRQGGDFYRATWKAAVASEPDWILLTSFNEWHEGTEVEPSEQHGDQYLNLTRELVDAWKAGGE